MTADISFCGASVIFSSLYAWSFGEYFYLTPLPNKSIGMTWLLLGGSLEVKKQTWLIHCWMDTSLNPRLTGKSGLEMGVNRVSPCTAPYTSAMWPLTNHLFLLELLQWVSCTVVRIIRRRRRRIAATQPINPRQMKKSTKRRVSWRLTRRSASMLCFISHTGQTLEVSCMPWSSSDRPAKPEALMWCSDVSTSGGSWKNSQGGQFFW